MATSYFPQQQNIATNFEQTKAPVWISDCFSKMVLASYSKRSFWPNTTPFWCRGWRSRFRAIAKKKENEASVLENIIKNRIYLQNAWTCQLFGFLIWWKVSAKILFHFERKQNPTWNSFLLTVASVLRLVAIRYLSLIHRILGIRLVYKITNSKRFISFEYMNRQLVWHGFTVNFFFLVRHLSNISSFWSLQHPTRNSSSSWCL